MAILNFDPTRTTVLRRQYIAEMNRRFRALIREVIDTIDIKDALGLRDTIPFAFNVDVEREAWRFQTDSAKIQSFNRWFQSQIDQLILSVDVSGKPWTSFYVESAYIKGVTRGFTDVRRSELSSSPEFFDGTKEQFLSSSFSSQITVSKLRFLATRSFNELKGITDAISQQLNRVLADGLARGAGPREIARIMARTITAINIQRARTLARTEIIAAHSEGQLDSFEALGVTEVGVMAEFTTAGDDRVCPRCAALEGEIMTIEEARGLIPRHANCRCAWIPANVGEPRPGLIFPPQPAIERSLIAELPKSAPSRTVAAAKRRSTWVGKELLNRKPRKPIVPFNPGEET